MRYYSLGDVQIIDATSHLRKNRERFLPSGVASGPHLAGRIVEDALLVGAKRVHVYHASGWWIIASETDWLPVGSVEDTKSLFTVVTSFPEGGPNSMRSEVLLGAFATDVATYRQGEWLTIQGCNIDPCTLGMDHASWERAIAFRVDS
jgi:hypothetical protein